jgi:Flp pilus assembly protein TadB
MPPVVLLLISVLSPGYASPLVTTKLGLSLVGVGAVLAVVGWRWLHSLANPEITL